MLYLKFITTHLQTCVVLEVYTLSKYVVCKSLYHRWLYIHIHVRPIVRVYEVMIFVDLSCKRGLIMSRYD